MIDRAALLADLRRQLRLLERDVAGRAEDVPEMAAALEAEYRAARAAERTGDTFGVWRAGELTQAAVAWLLGCVFVRLLEDNGLVEAPLIVGPDARHARATDRQTLYFRDRPTDTDRDYLLDAFATIARLPALAGLYDCTRNPVWRHGISGDAARDLLAFWRTVDPDTGMLRHDFTDPEWDTRFLGDLYQDLSDDAKKRFALLQTPEFVEEFILDRSLTPALDEFGLAGTRLIDPACGSGHFLLGAFHRLLRAWFACEPATPASALAQRSHIERLKDAPAFTIHVAAGDSLLHGRRFGELDLGSGAEQLAGHDRFGHAFLVEDLDALNRILGQQYHVVVGNPPYITVKDRATVPRAVSDVSSSVFTCRAVHRAILRLGSTGSRSSARRIRGADHGQLVYEARVREEAGRVVPSERGTGTARASGKLGRAAAGRTDTSVPWPSIRGCCFRRSR